MMGYHTTLCVVLGFLQYSGGFQDLYGFMVHRRKCQRRPDSRDLHVEPVVPAKAKGAKT